MDRPGPLTFDIPLRAVNIKVPQDVVSAVFTVIRGPDLSIDADFNRYKFSRGGFISGGEIHDFLLKISFFMS
jgi:hypothetical protein